MRKDSLRATNILLAAAAGLATASYLIHRQSATRPRKERRNAANARRTKPGIICTALSLIITFGVIPALIAAPFILTYLVTQSIEKAIFYPIIIICGIISFGCAIAAVGYLIVRFLHFIWQNCTKPLALRFQQQRDTTAPTRR